MDKKKNIIFFVTGLDSGGLERYLLRFLQYKSNEFENIFVFCKGGKGGQLEKQFYSIPNISIHKRKIGYFNLKGYLFIYNFIKKNKISVVCDFTGNFAGLVLLSAKWAGVPNRIAFYRGSDNHFKESKLRLLYNQFVKRLTLKNATNILSNSKAAFSFFYPKQWEKDSRFEVIYNGIISKPFIEEKENLRAEFNIPTDAFVIGHTGRFNEAKNHITITNVAIELCKNHKDIYFLMCGNGVKDNLESIIMNENLENRIVLNNNRSDIPRILKTLDCFYFPSISEGQPNALIEALVSSLPFVASNIEPIKEIIPEELHSELISPTDSEQAIEKILEIKNNQNYAETLNLTNYAINKFNPEELFGNFCRLLTK